MTKSKNIPDKPVLQFLRDLPCYPDSNIKQTGTLIDYEPRPVNCVLMAMPPNTREKAGRAKMQSLLDRGLADGCNCGCRGDFTLTTKGLEYLNAADA